MAQLVVGTFNIRNGRAFDGCRSWPFRRRAVLATIEALDADLLGLQEVFRFQLRWLRRRLPAYQVEWVGRDDGRRGEGCPVLVRRSAARVVEARTVWFGEGEQRPGLRLEGARFPRIATTCRVELADRRRVDVTSTHLDSASGDRRRRSAEQLVASLDPTVPQVVVGDLNAVPDDDVLEALAAAGFRDTLPPDAPGTFHRFTGRRDGPRIDYVLVDDGFEVLDAAVRSERVSRRPASDHWPVVATLRLRDA